MTDFMTMQLNSVSRKFKDKQDLYLIEIQDFFNQSKENHYANSENEIEAVDVIQSVGALREFMIGNVIKYVLRFGKKDGFNKKDLFKAIQYLIWLSILTEHPSNSEVNRKHHDNPLQMFMTSGNNDSKEFSNVKKPIEYQYDDEEPR